MIDITKPEYKDSSLSLITELHNRCFTIRWDGCLHIEDFSNGDTLEKHSQSNRDYLHICDVPEFIAQLQEVLTKAKEKGFEL